MSLRMWKDLSHFKYLSWLVVYMENNTYDSHLISRWNKKTLNKSEITTIYMSKNLHISKASSVTGKYWHKIFYWPNHSSLRTLKQAKIMKSLPSNDLNILNHHFITVTLNSVSDCT